MNAGGVTYAKWKCCSRAEQNEQNPLRFDLPGDVHVVGTPHRPRNPGQPRRLAPHTPCDALHLQPRGLPAHLPGTLPIRFWQGRAGLLAIVSGSGAIFVATIHFGSASVEPPADIINMYEPRIVGWLAFAWLVVFVAVLLGTCMYELPKWFGQRETRSLRPRGGE